MFNNSVFLNNLGKNMVRWATCLLLMLLPEKKTYIYLEMSLTRLFAAPDQGSGIDERKFFEVVHNCNYSKEAFNLSYFAFDSIWTNPFLDELISIDGRSYPIREVLSNKSLFDKAGKSAIHIFLDRLPNIIKYRIGIDESYKEREVVDSLFKFASCKLDTI